MQSRILKVSETEEKIDRMMTVAAANSKLIADHMEQLKKQQQDWWLAFHALRQLNEVGREVPFTEESLAARLKSMTEQDPCILAAKIAVEGRE